MLDISGYVMFFIISFAGYFLFRRFLPIPKFTGPIFAIGLAGCLGVHIAAPIFLKPLFSVFVGVNFAQRFNRGTTAIIRKMPLPVLLNMGWYFVFAILLSGFIESNTGIDPMTSFFCAIPGGLGETTLLALSFGAEISVVAVFQLARLLSIVIFVPLIVTRIFSNEKTEGAKDSIGRIGERTEPERYIIYLVAGVGGLLFYLLHLPADFLMGSLIFGGLYVNLRPEYLHPPTTFSDVSIISLGGIIGTSFTRESIAAMSDFAIWAVAVVLIIFLSCAVLALLMNRIFGIKYITAFVGVIPGGLLPVMMLCENLGLDLAKVIVLQITRMITAVMIIPMVLGFFPQVFF